MEQVGLILEGGGMRGAFTAGVLDCWLDRGLMFKDVYAVSAGACQACSYLCRQPGRGLRIWIDYLRDPRFCSFRSLISTGNLFGAKLNYDLVPRLYDPIDNDAFRRSGSRLWAVVTNVQTGLAEYLPVTDMIADIRIVQASASMPLISRPVPVDGRFYLDGGVADSIPLHRSIDDGHARNVLVLTREAGYRKSLNRAMPLMRLRYQRFPKLVEAIADRHVRYNSTLEDIDRAVSAGRAFVLRPQTPPEVGRVERDPDKLRRLYAIGRADAERTWTALVDFLSGASGVSFE